MTWLLVIRGKDQGRRYKLSSGHTYSIGREKSSDIRLGDDEVSRKHAKIIVEEDVITVVDLGSSNGTFVNSERIEVATLNKGDYLSIGPTSFMLALASKDVGFFQKSRVELESSMLEEGESGFDNQASAADDIADSAQWVSPVNSDLQFMYGAAMAISHASEIVQLFEEILDLIIEWLKVDRGCVLLWDEKKQKYQPRATRYRTSESESVAPKISSSIINYVNQRKEGILTSDARQDDRLVKLLNPLKDDVQEVICVPIHGRSSTHGFIYMDRIRREGVDESPDPPLNEDHLKLLVAIGNQVAVIIENQEYYSALVESERHTAVGQTLATLSHHIKNILQSIQGGNHLVEDGLKTDDIGLVKKGWKIVKRNQQNMSKLVMDMVTISKPGELNQKRNDLNRTIERAVLNAVEVAENLAANVYWQRNPDVKESSYDDAQIERALENVLKQIFGASADGHNGSVTVELKKKTNLLKIVIQDDFQVVTDSKLAGLFRPFAYQNEIAIHGIGLAVTQKIMRDHDGDIVVSRRPNKGMRFVLWLPISDSVDDHQTGTVILAKEKRERGSSV